jgi:hypothetical protein
LPANDISRAFVPVPASLSVATINVVETVPVLARAPRNPIEVPSNKIPGFPLTPVEASTGLPTFVACFARPLLSFHEVIAVPLEGFVPVPVTSAASSHNISVP